MYWGAGVKGAWAAGVAAMTSFASHYVMSRRTQPHEHRLGLGTNALPGGCEKLGGAPIDVISEVVCAVVAAVLLDEEE